MKAGCERARDLMLEVDTLDDTTKAWLDGHLTACRECREEWTMIEQFGDFMNEARPELPDDFADGILAAVRAEAEPMPSRLPAVMAAVGALAGAALLLTLTGIRGELVTGWTAGTEMLAAWCHLAGAWLGEQSSGVTFTVHEWLPPVSVNGSLVIGTLLLLAAGGMLTLYQSSREVR